jgi:2-polyprenyl-3-methyl-5-hydroxy-6-metoxy-1,4-benzoquinol methylase
LKHFLYNIKQNLKGLFIYPKANFTKVDYNAYWQEKKKGKLGVPNAFQLYRGNWISKFISREDTLLDIASGDGSVINVINSQVNVKAIGTDLSSVAREILKEQGYQGLFFDTNQTKEIQNLPQVDHILLLEILEHMPEPETFLMEIIKKANKTVFFSFPNSGYWTHRLRFLLGRFPMQWRIHPGEHLRFWTLKDLEWWLTAINLFEKSEVHTYFGIPILNKLCKSLFSQGFIVKITVDKKL